MLKAALSCSVEALSLLPSDLVLPVLSFMETLLPQVSVAVDEGNETVFPATNGQFGGSWCAMRSCCVWRR